MLTSEEFTFNVPAGWTRAAGEGLVYLDGGGGVMIVSSWRITPAGSSELLQDLLSNAFASVRRAAADPQLVQVSELHEFAHATLRCWIAESRTRDGALCFSQCVLSSERGVLLATLESPAPAEAHRHVFQTFLSGVRRQTGFDS
jgi:hypothetical protein